MSGVNQHHGAAIHVMMKVRFLGNNNVYLYLDLIIQMNWYYGDAILIIGEVRITE